jgi:hypothetical protein
LHRLTGRPAYDSPVWKFRRSYFTGEGEDASSNEPAAVGSGERSSSKP